MDGNVTTTKSDRSRSMSGQIVKKPTVYPNNDVNWGHFFCLAVHKITQDTKYYVSVIKWKDQMSLVRWLVQPALVDLLKLCRSYTQTYAFLNRLYNPILLSTKELPHEPSCDKLELFFNILTWYKPYIMAWEGRWTPLALKISDGQHLAHIWTLPLADILLSVWMSLVWSAGCYLFVHSLTVLYDSNEWARVSITQTCSSTMSFVLICGATKI